MDKMIKDYGFVRVAALKPVVALTDPECNAQRMAEMLREVAKKGVQLAVFPELGITGYSCGDHFLQDKLLNDAEKAARDYIEATDDLELISIFGMPLRVGDQLFNVAVVCQKGKVLAIIPKTFLPNYKEFYEVRHFSPAERLTVKEVDFCGQKVPIGTDIVIDTDIRHFSIGVEICEDLWMQIPPSSHLVSQGATIIVNLSASNEVVGKAEYRHKLVENQSARCVCGYVYVSCGWGESTSDVVWSGHRIIADNGTVVAEDRDVFMNEKIVMADIDVQRLSRERRLSSSFSQAVTHEAHMSGVSYRHIKTTVRPLDVRTRGLLAPVNPNPFVPNDPNILDQRCDEILDLQAASIARRLWGMQKKEVVIGISGGLDSTLALLATVRAFDVLGWDRSGIIAITMPGFGTSKRTKNNAVKLCKELGVTLRTMNIKRTANSIFRDVGHYPPCMNCLKCENVQARLRTLLLMTEGFVIGTGDLSELILGCCTFNGDHMSMYNPNGGVPKSLVRFVVERVAKRNLLGDKVSKILLDICETPISPELLPGQETEALFGNYALNDFFIYHTLRNGFEPEKIHFLACAAYERTYNPEDVKSQLTKFYQRKFAAQFKRNAMPDGTKVGSVAVSPRGDLRLPSDAIVRSWIEAVENIEC